jgi:hypothetical protein
MSQPTIKKATKEGEGKWIHWWVEYEEFPGRYYLHDTEYRLRKYVQKLLQERTILPDEIEALLDLHSDVKEHDRNMEECD